MKIAVTVNGRRYEREVEPRMLLAYFLREDLGLTGTHVGCDSSSCGCCVVVLDGDRAVKSCTMFAVMADGHEITTVEGLEQGGVLHPLQQAFWDQHGLQCGYCTPGMMLTAYALAATQSPTRARPAFAKRFRGICAAARAIKTSSRRSSKLLPHSRRRRRSRHEQHDRRRQATRHRATR